MTGIAETRILGVAARYAAQIQQLLALQVEHSSQRLLTLPRAVNEATGQSALARTASGTIDVRA